MAHGKHTVSCESEGRDQYEYEQSKAQSCQGIDADTLKACGEGSDYCSPCVSCAKPVCENHGVMLPGLTGSWCFSCAKVALDEDDAAEEMLKQDEFNRMVAA